MSFLNDQDAARITPKIKLLQFIVGGLCSGIFLFTCIGLVGRGAPICWDLATIFAIAGLAFALLSLASSQLLPALLKSQPAPSDIDRAYERIQTLTIIRAAVVDGAAFLNLVAYLAEGNGFNLIAVLACLGGLFLLFPTSSRVISQIESLRR